MFDWIKRLAIIAILVFFVYSGIQFGMPYYRFYAFRSDAAEVVRFTYLGISQRKRMEQLREKMYEKSQEVKVPITTDDIRVETTETGYWVYVQWEETVDILGQYQKTLQFEFEVSS